MHTMQQRLQLHMVRLVPSPYITAQSFLKILNLPSGGHMVAALALMESPAIIVGLAE